MLSRRSLFGVLLLAFFFNIEKISGGKISDEGQSICPSQLPKLADAILNRPEYKRAHWGVMIAVQNSTGGSPQILYSHNSDSFFAPASNNKLLTSSSLFVTLPPTWTYKTDFLYNKATGTVCVMASGDPSISFQNLQDAATALKQKGISSISSLVMDGSIFKEAILSFPTSWEYDDVTSGDGAAPTAFILNQNQVGFTVHPAQKIGQPAHVSYLNPDDSSIIKLQSEVLTIAGDSSATVVHYDYVPGGNVFVVRGVIGVQSAPFVNGGSALEPEVRFQKMLSIYLKRSSVSVSSVSVGQCPGSLNTSGWTVAHTIESPPLKDLMYHTLQVSDNLMAEIFLKTLGVVTGGASGLTTAQAGINQVQKILTSFGVEPGSFFQRDGSGLSVQDAVTPRAFIQLLTHMTTLPNFELYKSFLPIAGKSGTLAGRFIGTPAEGIVFAKTGTLTGVASLSGYMSHPEYNQVMFSVIANNNPLIPHSEITKGIDDIILLLPQLRNC